jgi:hypothetical protein
VAVIDILLMSLVYAYGACNLDEHYKIKVNFKVKRVVQMNISELSKLSGLNTPTIRYYEQIKLLPKAKRLANGYRKYSEDDLQQLHLIKQAQQVGFTLEEIKSLIPANISNWNHEKLIETLND